MSKLKITIVGITTAIWLSGMLVLVPMTVRAADNYTWSVNLKLGSTGADVKALQQFLNKDTATQVSTTGAGSPGNETSYFGTKTKAAVVKFQEKYAAAILTPIGLTKGTGNVASMTRAKLNALYSAGGGVVTPPTGTGLALSSPTQPAASLAPEGAARLPFTKVTFTAGTDGDVVVSGVNVERTGLANDAVFAGVVLLDENGQQFGISKTFNSDHKLIVGDSFTVKAGQSRTMTIAGNMLDDGVTSTNALSTYAGQVAYLSVTGAVTSATVSGTLPITGAGNTINGTLSIGSATPTRGVTDPGTNQTAKEVGVTGYTFSAIRITAGSAEKIRVKSIRWNQSGSAATGDLANIKTYVDGTAYDTVVSSDGKYYTSTLGSGIVVDKGSNVELAIKGDIAGGSARTIKFDVYKNTDVYVTGETYGYGITPTAGTVTTCTATVSQGSFCTTNPWYNAFTVTVSNGTLNVAKATAVAAQNIAINLSNQPLGGFTVEVKGEPISVTSMYFYFLIATSSGTSLLNMADITNITLVDENGTVVAGPNDGTVVTFRDGYVRFTDTVTFPIGKKTYTLKGKLGTDFGNNDTITASTTPSTNWTPATGQTTGNSITASPTSAITANTMTVKSTSLAITVSGDPVVQTVVSGGRFTFANYRFDASASGEDVRMANVPLAYYTATAANGTNLTSCQLYDGSTSLTTGSNIVNPAAITTTSSSTVFTFDGTGLIVSKGTIKTLALQCDIAGGATGTYYWGIDAGATWTNLGTGLTSGQSFTPTVSADNMGQAITLAAGGTLTVSTDSSSPSYAIAAAGSTGVPVVVLKFHAATEAISLQKIGLKLTNTASSSATDLTGVTLWAGGVQVGTAVFTSTNYATTTLTTPVLINKDSDKLVTVKLDLSAVGISQPGTEGALIAVDYNGSDLAGTYGTGQNSGTTRTSESTSSSTASGVRMFRSYPTFAKISLSTSEKVLSSGTGLPLYKFSVTANPASGNGLGIYVFNVSVATSTGSGSGYGTTSVTNLKIYAYTDSGFSTPVSGSTFTNGQIVTTIPSLVGATPFDNVATTTAVLQIPAGSTYYFKVTGDISFTYTTGTGSGWVRTYIQGDTAYPALATHMGLASTTSTSKFIWSPNATTTSGTTTNADWTNGYYVSGLPSTGMDSEVISK